MRKRFNGKRYADLVQHYIARYPERALLDLFVRLRGAVNESIQWTVVDGYLERWGSRAADAEWWETECIGAMEAMADDARASAERAGTLPDDATLWYMSQMATVGLAYAALRSKRMRTQLGLRKSYFRP